jgi:hypothetical protein
VGKGHKVPIKELKVLRVGKVQQEMLVRKEPKGLKGLKVLHQERQGLRVLLLELKEHQGFKVLQVRQVVHQVLKGLQVHKVQQVFKGLQVHKVVVEQQGLKDHQEVKGQEEPQVDKVLKEQQELKGHHQTKDLKIILPNLKMYYLQLKKLRELGLHGIMNTLKLKIINQLLLNTHLKEVLLV